MVHAKSDLRNKISVKQERQKGRERKERTASFDCVGFRATKKNRLYIHLTKVKWRKKTRRKKAATNKRTGEKKQRTPQQLGSKRRRKGSKQEEERRKKRKYGEKKGRRRKEEEKEEKKKKKHMEQTCSTWGRRRASAFLSLSISLSLREL